MKNQFLGSQQKRIVRTGAEVQAEEEKRKRDTSCPECGTPAFAGVYHVEGHGFLGLKHRRVITYHCRNCKCEYQMTEDL